MDRAAIHARLGSAVVRHSIVKVSFASEMYARSLCVKMESGMKGKMALTAEAAVFDVPKKQAGR